MIRGTSLMAALPFGGCFATADRAVLNPQDLFAPMLCTCFLDGIPEVDGVATSKKHVH